VFESDARTAAWTARYREEAALTALIRRHLPRPLAERVRVAGTKDGVLELAAAAGAVAAVVRQRTPELATVLRREGWDFTEIRIRVQVTATVALSPKMLSRQLDTRASALFDFGDRLPEGPLKSALARWARRARGR
jgi:hypothetical protein